MVELAARLARDLEREGGRVKVIPADVSDARSVSSMFDTCERELGEVRVLVLNAAVRVRRAWTEIDESDWDRVSAVNLKAAFLCSRRAFAKPASAGGAIVTISSVQAVLGAAGVLPYATTKAGLLGFTRSLARELGPRGIRVNCVMPGAIQTEEELEQGIDQDAVHAQLMSIQAIQRRGVAEDVANVVSFLVGPESSFITGQTLCVDGGWVMR
ncbi:3-oxoacyl-[acyl-carrier protein] reductase [Novosphingobium mathurense]|uniref:3-oxoacyl-[acyl-carrier protein] reductase n=2 Tax=Novosphingobium mathurense TaxID=428990 RepID=A0A1U6IL82_9SPHN|nr:3-oxoacyl-[acyl-carrier protein] reductase [Novosphingobium mathurense]